MTWWRRWFTDYLSHPVVLILLHSLFMKINVSSLPPHNLYPLFCCVSSIFASVFIALFCATINKFSLSLKIYFSYPCSVRSSRVPFPQSVAWSIHSSFSFISVFLFLLFLFCFVFVLGLLGGGLFLVLPLPFLDFVISLSFLFFMYSWSLCIDIMRNT